MGMVSSSATSRVITLFRSLLFATATSVAFISLLLLAFSFFDTSARWFDFAGGVLFVVGGCALLATVASALVRGPTTRIKNSNAEIRLIFRYLRYDAGWFRIVFGFLFAIAVVALILFETSGVANGNVLSDHGRYILTNDSGSSSITLAEFNRMSTAREVWYPTSAALLFANAAIIRILAENHSRSTSTRSDSRP